MTAVGAELERPFADRIQRRDRFTRGRIVRDHPPRLTLAVALHRRVGDPLAVRTEDQRADVVEARLRLSVQDHATASVDLGGVGQPGTVAAELDSRAGAEES